MQEMQHILPINQVSRIAPDTTLAVRRPSNKPSSLLPDAGALSHLHTPATRHLAAQINGNTLRFKKQHMQMPALTPDCVDPLPFSGWKSSSDTVSSDQFQPIDIASCDQFTC